MNRALGLVPTREPRQRRRDLGGVVAHHQVAADEVEVAVGESGARLREAARRVQIEEHGAAADEWLEIAPELGGIERPERRQKLAFAARPFQERPGARVRAWCLVPGAWCGARCLVPACGAGCRVPGCAEVLHLLLSIRNERRDLVNPIGGHLPRVRRSVLACVM